MRNVFTECEIEAMQRSSYARYQWPVFEPVRADTGNLRILPGSHHREFQWAVRQADASELVRA